MDEYLLPSRVNRSLSVNAGNRDSRFAARRLTTTRIRSDNIEWRLCYFTVRYTRAIKGAAIFNCH